MELFAYYESLDRKEKSLLRKRIIQACMIEPPTFYSWFKKKNIPERLRRLISIELQQPVEDLFPSNEPIKTTCSHV